MTFWRGLRGFLHKLFNLRPRSEAGSAPPRFGTWTRPRIDLAQWQGTGSPAPMMWKECHPRTRSTFKAELTCSNGHAVSLRGHSIEVDGVVSPSVVCTVPGCNFHDFVRLSGWSAGAL